MYTSATSLAHIFRTRYWFENNETFIFLLFPFQTFKSRFVDLSRVQYTTKANDIQLSFIGTNSSGKQCAGIYPAQLVGGRWPQAPIPSTQLRPMHKPPLASAGIYWAGKNSTSGAAPGGRTAAVGSTTTSHRLVVSKCAFGLA